MTSWTCLKCFFFFLNLLLVSLKKLIYILSTIYSFPRHLLYAYSCNSKFTYGCMVMEYFFYFIIIKYIYLRGYDLPVTHEIF